MLDGRAVPLVPQVGLIDPVAGLAEIDGLEARVHRLELVAPRVVVRDALSERERITEAQEPDASGRLLGLDLRRAAETEGVRPHSALPAPVVGQVHGRTAGPSQQRIVRAERARGGRAGPRHREHQAARAFDEDEQQRAPEERPGDRADPGGAWTATRTPRLVARLRARVGRGFGAHDSPRRSSRGYGHRSGRESKTQDGRRRAGRSGRSWRARGIRRPPRARTRATPPALSSPGGGSVVEPRHGTHLRADRRAARRRRPYRGCVSGRVPIVIGERAGIRRLPAPGPAEAHESATGGGA